MVDIKKVEWSENRRYGYGAVETIFIIGERVGEDWIFYERSSWEVPYTPIERNDRLVQRAEELYGIMIETRRLTDLKRRLGRIEVLSGLGGRICLDK